MKKLLLSCVILPLAFLGGCGKKHESYVPLKSGDKIMAFGDSLTFGYGAESQPYPKTLAEITGFNVVNYGVNGDTTSSGLNRLEDALIQESPQLVILSLGGNDMLRKVPTATITNNLKQMIKIIEKHNSQVVLLAEPQPRLMDVVLGSSVLDLNDAEFYEVVAKEHKIFNIEKVYSKLLSNQENKSDLIHLNEKGYTKAANMIAEQLKSAKILEK